jgi:hypothetical protein
MLLRAKETLELVDGSQRALGQIEIEREDAGLVVGEFIPEPAFSAVQPLFREYEEAVNVQALSVVDSLDTKIDQLGLCVTLPDGEKVAIHDVQIWSDGGISFRRSTS